MRAFWFLYHRFGLIDNGNCPQERLIRKKNFLVHSTDVIRPRPGRDYIQSIPGTESGSDRESSRCDRTGNHRCRSVDELKREMEDV